mgnify:FL=1
MLLMIGQENIRCAVVDLFVTFYGNRQKKQPAGELRPDFSGIVSPEMSVSQPASDHGSQCREDGQNQKDGQTDADLVNDV